MESTLEILSCSLYAYRLLSKDIYECFPEFKSSPMGKSRENMHKATLCLLRVFSPLGVLNDERQFVKSMPGSVRCILFDRKLRLDIRVCTVITNYVQSSFSF